MPSGDALRVEFYDLKKYGGLSYLEWREMSPFWRKMFTKRLIEDVKAEREGKKGMWAQIQQMMGGLFKR